MMKKLCTLLLAAACFTASAQSACESSPLVFHWQDSSEGWLPASEANLACQLIQTSDALLMLAYNQTPVMRSGDLTSNLFLDAACLSTVDVTLKNPTSSGNANARLYAYGPNTNEAMCSWSFLVDTGMTDYATYTVNLTSPPVVGQFSGEVARFGLRGPWGVSYGDTVYWKNLAVTPYMFGCTDIMACNYDAAANLDDGSCEGFPTGYCDCDGTVSDTNNDGVCDEDEIYGCDDSFACNYHPEATEDDGSCVYPGDACQDDNEATINEAYNGDCECVGVDFLETCNYIGHPEWLNMGLGVYSSEFSLIDSSLTGYNLIVGEAFGTELVLNMPLVFTDEVTGGSFQVLSWSNLVADNVPPGVDLSVPETLEGGSQACLEMSGVDYPTEEGLFEVSIVGEVVMNFFGTPISIGDVSTSFLIQVSSNPNGVPGCMYETASNFMPWATFDVGICEFEGCTDPAAFNFSPAHTLEDGSCLYTDPSGCDESEEDHQLCLEGTVWSEELGGCVVANVSDTDFDGCVGINDFLVHLSNFGSGCGPEPAWACGDPLEYQGYDYETVQIGEQCWFAENLRAENYRNGDPIPSGLSDGDEWAGTTEGAVDVDEGDYLSTYGRLYNGYTAADERRLCPSTWSVPTDEDWMELEMALGMSESEANSTGWRGTDEGIQMKTTYGWLDDENGTNVSGFSGLPGGAKATVGHFYDAGYSGNWWSSSNSDDANAWYRDLELTSPAQVYRASTNRNHGFSVRCIKDTE